MDKEKLQKILEDHRLWLEGKGGEKANLSNADLSDADLSGADLSDANLGGADLSNANLGGANLSNANLGRADLSNANLGGADLSDANLGRADLSGADLDFSVLPLRCGGLRWKIDRRIAAQFAYHLCSMECDDPDFIRARNSILDFANRFHRADDCGRLLPVAIKEGE
jgi:hypothetical protein